MQTDVTPPEKSVPTLEKPKWERVLPSYKALHQMKPAQPAPVDEKRVPEAKKATSGDISLAEAMLLPYYWSLYKLEKEKSAPGVVKPAYEPQKTTVEAKKAVEAVMFPFYRTLSREEPERPLSTVEKTISGKELPPPGSHPPGCARQRHPLKPF